MLSVVALVLVLAQSPVVTPPAGQPPLGFPAAAEPLRIERAAIAWQGPNYRLAWSDRRRFFDQGSLEEVWTAEWSDVSRQLTNLTLQRSGLVVSDVKLAVGRTDTRLYVLQATGAASTVVTVSLSGAATPTPQMVAAPGVIAVGAVEDEFLLATRGVGGVSLVRPGGIEHVSAGAFTDLRVTAADGGFLVSFLDPMPPMASVPAGMFVPSRVAPGVSLGMPGLFAPVPREPPSFVVLNSLGLQLQVPDAGSFQAWPLQLMAAMPTLVTSFPDAGLTLAVNSFGAVSVPSAGGTSRGVVINLGLPLSMDSHDDTASVVLRQGLGVAIRRIDVAPTSPPSILVPANLVRPAPQRAPSAVWSAEAGGFLVAWEERTPAGFSVWLSIVDTSGMQVTPRQVTSTPMPSGYAPRLLALPDGGVLLKLRQPVDGGFVGAFSSVDFPVITPTALPPIPDTSSVDFGSTGFVRWSQTPTMVFTERSGGFTFLSMPAPRCVASIGDTWWFGGLFNNEFLFQPIPSGVLVRRTLVAPNASGCTALSADGNTLMSAVRTNTTVEVQQFMPGGLLDAGSLRVDGGDPVVTALGDGFLVAVPAGNTLSAWHVREPSQQWVSIPLGPTGGEVGELVAASSPRGDALLAWRAYEPDGRHSVRLRLVSVPRLDGGVDAGVVDAGVVDAGVGVVDAGVVDAGVVVIDAGIVDAGVIARDGGETSFDAGPVDSVDAGVVDGGAAGPVEFVPVCGCTSVDGRLVAVLTLVLALTRRRGREAARDVFR